jgi:hypothetical protein
VSDHAQLCECGCGLPTPIAQRNRKSIGHIKGQPVRFIQGHRFTALGAERRERTEELLRAYEGNGLCECGCGGKAPIAKGTNRKRGYVKGQPQRFIFGHSGRREAAACEADGCDTETTSQYCVKHYTRMRRHGDLVGQRPSGPAEERYWRYVDQTGTCWLWTGSVADTGYGVHWTDARKLVGAHRYSYELLVGPIPEDLHLDHLCRVRNCVNPEHLEPVTPAENVRRGVEARRLEAARQEPTP